MARFYSKKVSDPIYGEFDSTTEHNYFTKVLKPLEEKGEIWDLNRQLPLLIQDKFKQKDGSTVRAIQYFSDFSYSDKDGFHIVDCKGGLYAEEVWKIKWKLIKYKYPKYNYHIIVNSKGIWLDLESKQDKKIMKENVKSKKAKTTTTKKKTKK